MTKKLFNWKYTIGEILIVSVGIMIAFSINTCASNIKESNIHEEYKTSLLADLDQNLEHLKDIISSQETKVISLNKVANSIEKGELDSVGLILFKERKSPTFYPISGTFKSLVSHGEVKLFSTDIKRDLFNLYDTWYAKTEYNGNLYDKMHLEIYESEIREILDFKTKEVFNPEKLATIEFTRNLRFIIDEAESYLKLVYKSQNESERIRNLLMKS